jgi:hypothetical protein
MAFGGFGVMYVRASRSVLGYCNIASKKQREALEGLYAAGKSRYSLTKVRTASKKYGAWPADTASM